MESSSRPAIVIVHGIWHSPLTFHKFTLALQKAGYDVFCPFLPSCAGSRPPTVSMPEDTQVVRRLVEMLVDQGRLVVMALHSYGGAVGCSALEGLDAQHRAAEGRKGGVIHILALTAHLHPKDFTIMNIITEMGDDHLVPYALEVDKDNSCFSMDAQTSFFSELPKEESDLLMPTLSRANYDVFHSKVQYEAWKYIPVTYILTTKDMMMPVHYQERIIEKMAAAGTKVEVVKMETGHSSFLTQTAELVRVIDDIASKAS